MVLSKNSEALIQTWENKTEYQRFKLCCPKCGKENTFDNNEYIQGLINTDLVLSDEIAVLSYTCYHCKETMDFNLSKFYVSQEIVMKLFLKHKDFILGKIFENNNFIAELSKIFYNRISVSNEEMNESVELLIESFDGDEWNNFNEKTKEELVVYGMQVLHKYLHKTLITDFNKK